MKRTAMAVMMAALVVGTGCNKSTPGGPGATGTTGTTTNSKGTVTTTATSNSSGGTFTLKPPVNPLGTSLKQGETKDVEIGITRKDFDGDVKLTFEGLPKGVTIDPASPTIKHGEDNVHVKVKAADDAALDKHTITIHGQSDKGGSEGKAEMTLKVNKK